MNLIVENLQHCYLVIGDKEDQNDLKVKFGVNPPRLSGKRKEAKEDKNLEDYISEEGLGKSTISTIKKRYNKLMNTLAQIKAVIEDTRAQINGGIVIGMEIWEVAVMPYLLNNGETWCEILNELPDALKCSKLQWKNVVNKKIKKMNDLLNMILEKRVQKDRLTTDNN